MRSRERRADEMLVAQGHVQYGAGARHKEPLVGVRDEEIWVERGEVEGERADALCGVDEAEDVVLSTRCDHVFKGEPHAGDRGHGVEEGEARAVA